MECPLEVSPGGIWAYCLCVFSYAMFQVEIYRLHMTRHFH